MGRLWLTVILPLLLPTVVYVLWTVATRRTRRAGLLQSWPWLLTAGLALSACVLVAAWLRAGTGGPGTDSYVPPHVVEGKVVPGRLTPPAR